MSRAPNPTSSSSNGSEINLQVHEDKEEDDNKDNKDDNKDGNEDDNKNKENAPEVDRKLSLVRMRAGADLADIPEAWELEHSQRNRVLKIFRVIDGLVVVAQLVVIIGLFIYFPLHHPAVEVKVPFGYANPGFSVGSSSSSSLDGFRAATFPGFPVPVMCV